MLPGPTASPCGPTKVIGSGAAKLRLVVPSAGLIPVPEDDGPNSRSRLLLFSRPVMNMEEDPSARETRYKFEPSRAYKYVPVGSMAKWPTPEGAVAIGVYVPAARSAR